MLVIAIIAALSGGSYVGYDKYKIEDRKDKVVESCIELAQTSEETKHCGSK